MITNSQVHENIEDITEILNRKKIKDKVDEMQQEGDIKATVVIQSDNKVSIKNDFVILFLENFDRLITQLKLTTTELRVLIYILKKMEYGNLLTLNQKSVCVALNMKSSNVSAIFSKLKQKGVLVFDDEKNMYINSNLVMKGLKHRLPADKRENLKRSQLENDLFDKSY
ncbi:hypothetical protein C4Z15_016240 [Enterobacter hormaechei subsp. xiangfangensis]|jgi:hypothetical protein|uniref:hypothetical protein n=1 Tax=Enterobacteriaceae TaxID=543 RepID=UPI000CEC1431|nr:MULTISPECIES: hypothetical protein [Enterobacteriaceae]EAQ2260629.1 hypothetical protein [Salmonella enterica]MDX7038260.1 hypothetical protein [Enterobacter roggenkampii]ROD28013.1 hypothetical protein C4Z15_016240 [Enterobacter hormaechei subsp. xiangfangensis]GKN74907.1 hypothetical protein NUKP86_51500 [Klebsiella variicola]HCI8819882.1 hypothetical protein [Klebsiella variicola]